ncbi:hypothetical protein J3E71DRAFT_389803 [Bipolaris maydis]|nr:hypothetical protein J3E71DRAFT_389803 [Bipolaris maydis]
MSWVNRSVDMILQSARNKLRHLCPCPQDTGRTATGAVVKLFVATVTTVGIRGHFSSLSDVQSWKLQLFRALEILVNPLAALFHFALLFWYGFVDLLHINPGPWERDISLKYRLARFSGAYASTKSSSNECRTALGLVNPQHLEMIPSKRDLKWGGRVLILLTLLSQYAQAGVLLSRRILSNTAAGVDYAMAFLVISGLATLLKSLTISLLNVTWVRHEEIQPCTEKLCSLQECTAFKHAQGLPSQRSEIYFFKKEVSVILTIILCDLAGGWLQMSIMWWSDYSIWRLLLNLWTLQYALWDSVYYIILLHSLGGQPLDKSAPQPPDNSSPPTRQPSQTPTNSGLDEASPNHTKTLSWSDVSILTVISVAGVGYTLYFLVMVAFQLILLVAPCILLYSSIAVELSAWKTLDPARPCPQLWKDRLEDELWWF